MGYPSLDQEKEMSCNMINDFNRRYLRWSRVIKFKFGYNKAMKMAGGGEFEAFGLMQKDLLIQHGLKPNHYLIDVGCASGRLAIPISQYLTDGKYLGTDIVKDFLKYAKDHTPSSFTYKLVKKTEIPENNGVADMVCFFSVFTHILPEHTFLYLQEAKRVLKPNSKIIFSFFEFYISSHWTTFETDVKTIDKPRLFDMFLSREAINAFAQHLGLKIDNFYDGDKPHIRLNQPVKFEDGRILETIGQLGQSICVLSN
jgi:ubiquinone/menaquinone biosynthesis C-methylase UbiE